MRTQLVFILVPFMGVACDVADPDPSDPETSFTEATGKADGACVDVVGFDICRHRAQDVYDSMQIDSEDSGVFFGPDAVDGILRRGSFLGMEVTCSNFNDGAPKPFSCSFPITEGEPAMGLWQAMEFHPDFFTVGEEHRLEIREWFTGKLTGDTRIRSTRHVGVYECFGAIDFAGFTDEILVDQSSSHCTAIIQ